MLEIFSANKLLRKTLNSRLIEALQNHDIKKGGAKWLKEVKHEITKSFHKVRISKGRNKLNPEMNNLFQIRERLTTKM